MTDTDRRTEFVAALREIADLFEANPDLDLPINPRLGIVVVDAEGFAHQTHHLGGRREKAPTGEIMRVQRHFGPVLVEIVAMRNDVCTKRVVGTETVTVPAPDAPMVEVEREIIEWDCKPVLAQPAGADLAWHPDEEPFASEAVDDAIDARTEDRHERQATRS